MLFCGLLLTDTTIYSELESIGVKNHVWKQHGYQNPQKDSFLWRYPPNSGVVSVFKPFSNSEKYVISKKGNTHMSETELEEALTRAIELDDYRDERKGYLAPLTAPSTTAAPTLAATLPVASIKIASPS